jgi:hypothetical protein
LVDTIAASRTEDGEIGFGNWRQRRQPVKEKFSIRSELQAEFQSTSRVRMGRAAVVVLTSDRVTKSVGELAVSRAAK